MENVETLAKGYEFQSFGLRIFVKWKT